MSIRKGYYRWLFPLLGLVIAIRIHAQEESASEKQYREDYERVQKIVANPEPIRRADQLFAFIQQRPGSKLLDYAQSNYLQILEGLLKAENFQALLTQSERYIKIRPKVGETYYFHGAALRNLKRYPEAMDALAKCYVLRNPASRKAKEFLEHIYKSQNQGSLIGVDKIVKRAQDQVGK